VTSSPRPALRLIVGAASRSDESASWTWFCGHCAAPSPSGQPPPPTARVCRACGLGLLLETRRDVVPCSRDAYLVIDSALLVQALSRSAEKLLRVREDVAVNRPLTELLVAADADSGEDAQLARAIIEAVDGEDAPRRVQLRPANTFGVRMRADVAPCGPPRAALLVLERLQSVDSRSR
jgi:hypothetical protein